MRLTASIAVNGGGSRHMRAETDMRAGMSVEEVSRYTGVPANTIRYYARQNLLNPGRNPENGYRVFSERDLARLRFIRRAKVLGLTLGQIRIVFATVDRGGSPCALVRRMVRGRSRETAARIAELEALHERIERVLELWARMPDCPSDASTICRLVEAADEAAELLAVG